MRSLSSFATLFSAFVLAVNAKPAPAMGNVFAVYPGWDMTSQAEPSSPIHNLSEMQCLEACYAGASCIAYAYVPYGGDPHDSNKTPGSCYLKDTIVLTDFVKQSFDVSAGLIGPCGTFSPAGPTTCFTVTAQEEQSKERWSHVAFGIGPA
ncbi:hypothetical protein MSAN_00873300 [Mycena sanguinolenta]|uniref:Apple domain-containing protein n=1 Tax=Mycena sanguinolenta TaxID=230812 RepID=A0A8H6YZJ1_9AGAR|nr:hypothetical protein MSAN_00873300 [Mycena sanguinolenta]